VKCQKGMETPEEFRVCNELKLELAKCYDTLYALYYNTKREEVMK
jgi:hypothetical protein